MKEKSTLEFGQRIQVDERGNEGNSEHPAWDLCPSTAIAERIALKDPVCLFFPERVQSARRDTVQAAAIRGGRAVVPSEFGQPA